MNYFFVFYDSKHLASIAEKIKMRNLSPQSLCNISATLRHDIAHCVIPADLQMQADDLLCRVDDAFADFLARKRPARSYVYES